MPTLPVSSLRRVHSINIMAARLAIFASLAAAADAAGNRASLRRAAERFTYDPPTMTGIVSVADYGAIGDGTTDNTASFTSALAAAAAAGGGIVYVPPGNFSFASSLLVPASVALSGTFLAPPDSGNLAGGVPHGGSVLFPRAGRGNESGTPFLSLLENSALRGLVIYYPDVPVNATPGPYPWTVDMVGPNSAVLDCLLLNPWNAIRAVGAPRHYIARVQGQPSHTGVYVDETYDIGAGITRVVARQ